ncbi:hypothetical protein, partial [Pectobacterium versatile]|uniref:hypothetical protein n=1 Tax=Pectobacterium versatile TaxID=2488639 RepID=UPI0020BDACF8
NQGTVSGVGKLALDSGVINNAGSVIADGALALNGGAFDNTGTVIGERGITLELRNGLTVGSTGQLLTN